MNLLEGTVVLAVMSGVTFGTIEMANEVENQHAIFQEAQKKNLDKIRKLQSRGFKSDGHTNS